VTVKNQQWGRVQLLKHRGFTKKALKIVMSHYLRKVEARSLIFRPLIPKKSVKMQSKISKQ
jgi:hypothetical protein